MGESKEKEDKEEENKTPKEPGMVLFGTLFKYMGEKKEGEEAKDDKTAESVDKSSAVEDNSDPKGVSSDETKIGSGEDNQEASKELVKDSGTETKDDVTSPVEGKDHYYP